MALPKKGTRQIIVNDDTYRYRVRLGPDESNFGNFTRTRVLTVETPAGKIQQGIFEVNSITPKDVEHYIRKEILGE